MSAPNSLSLMTISRYLNLESQKLIKWDPVSRSWSPRNPDADWGVIFNSANDPTATAPTDINLRVGDEWVRSPLA